MDSNDPHHHNRGLMLFLQALITFIFVVALALAITHACGSPKKNQAASPPTPVPPPAGSAPCEDGSAIGTVRDAGCEAPKTGQTTQVCAMTPGAKDPSWITVGTNCAAPSPPPGPGPQPPPPPPPPGCGKSVFADVKPTLQDFCSGCHATITTFTTASAWAAEISRRVALPYNDNDHMPQRSAAKQLCDDADPAAKTSCDKVALLEKWVSDGALEDCQKPPSPPTPPPQTAALTDDYIAGLMVADAVNQNEADRKSLIYFSNAAAINDGITGKALKTWIDAINKGLNSLNPTGEDLVPVKALDAQGSVVRADLRNYGITPEKIAALDAADPFNIVDNTSKGLVLQALVGRAKPWYPADAFLDTAFRNAGVYYKFLEIPATLALYQKQIGVNLQNDLATLPNLPGTSTPQVNFIGDIGQITEGKNRLIVRDVQLGRSSTGLAYYHQTNDVNAVPHNVVIRGFRVDTKNLGQAPLLQGTGAKIGSVFPSVFNFTPDASETIAQSPNGLQAYGLWDAKGARLDAADPNIVIDTAVPSNIGNKQITVGNTCSRCHNDGVISMGDSTLAHVEDNAGQFNGTSDVILVEKLYHGDKANGALFAGDQRSFRAALQRLGIVPGADPQSVISDRLRGNWTISQAAGFFLLTVDEFRAALEKSQTAKSAIGQLLTGGTAPFDSVLGVEQQLIKDAHLFQDPL